MLPETAAMTRRFLQSTEFPQRILKSVLHSLCFEKQNQGENSLIFPDFAADYKDTLWPT